MMYFEYLNTRKKQFVEQLEYSLKSYKVQPVGNGYIDCITMKDNMKLFINEVSTIGILISVVTWWCYVDPSNNLSGCPHGMGGPISKYYEGWFSELQNEAYEVDEERLSSIIHFYDKQHITLLNQDTMNRIEQILKEPFRYTPSEYIKENKCVIPGLWLLVPDDWKSLS
ncbi:hypothetical protein GRF59_07000 [Paenibacillus sp. HJL G12]|uniref:Uncharacterized protein n=1 Tax=Paenibacillus dendrobii TaxID=2691084 RepID=A0A7X3IH04_9BACL|nr:hypothetical protein [Paenibacillus dendrobii]MWV43378.1 hypothetical protein [Paenibacillus dendrobii]